MNDVSRIADNETKLVGQWVREEGKVVEDDVAKRIQSLTNGVLKKVATADGGWLTLYLDPRDGRLWELQYPHSEMHGGGPPALICIDRDTATSRYGSDSS